MAIYYSTTRRHGGLVVPIPRPAPPPSVGWDGQPWVPSTADVDGRVDPDGAGGSGWMEDPSEPGTWVLHLEAGATEALDPDTAVGITFSPRDVLGAPASFPGVFFARLQILTPPPADSGVAIGVGWAEITESPYTVDTRSVCGGVYDQSDGTYRHFALSNLHLNLSSDSFSYGDVLATWLGHPAGSSARLVTTKAVAPYGNHPSNSSQATSGTVFTAGPARVKFYLMAYNLGGAAVSATIRVRPGLVFIPTGGWEP